MIVGRPGPGPTPLALAEGHLYLWDVGVAQLAEDLIVGSVIAFLDGGGPGSGEQVLRPVVAEGDDVGATAVVGEEVVVVDGQLADWQHLTFDLPPRLRAGHQPLFGLLAGPADQLARVLGVAGAGGQRWAVPYGPAVAPGNPDVADLNLVAPVVGLGVAPWTAPDVPDEQIAALPLDVAAATLGAGGPTGAAIAANAGWRYLHDDPPSPATCVVRTGGPLADLVGERISVTAAGGGVAPRSVVVYVDDEDEFDPELAAEDLQLSRVAFGRLAPLWTELLPVTVAVLT